MLMKTNLFLSLFLMLGTLLSGHRMGNRQTGVKIRIMVNGMVLMATLYDNETARDFEKLLPLEVRMDDLFGREKYGALPRALSTSGKRQDTFKVGEIGYWSPGTDVAIYYKQDHERIPSPGIIMIGSIDSGVEAVSYTHLTLPTTPYV